ncbi:UDP-glucose 4-epimerase GalE [Castellaniella ginsengisoli]|uniref:UDP-glucose 4-epimerase n=1 Tax=Castellaniella ginsengisoli TaxID=546114 RepID=A0AB39H2B5_9BURK
MNILLTGGTGYIGSHTATVLAQQGHHVVLFDNLSNSSEAVVGQLARILGAAPVFVRGDVRDEALLARTLRDHAIEAVIHFAGLKAVGESVEKPLDYFCNNVQGTLCLLQAMRAGGVRTLVFSSSATVYGEPQSLPLDERHPTRAVNPYGRSKLHIEEILSDLAASDPVWRLACLRYFNPVGAHDSGLIGESPRGVPNNLMPYVAQVAAGQRAELSVFGNDYPTLDGTGVRDYIHVMDLAEGHAAALGFLASHPGWHAINLGTGRGHSVLELVRAFEQASGRPVPYRIQPRRPGDVAACYADPAKARRDLGWTAARTLEDMCRSAWKYQQGAAVA